jgi:P pilus assembly chaperone PapD
MAAADLMVYPTRVVMNDRQRTAQVDIVNTSQIQATYKITLVRKRMMESGEFQDIIVPDPEEMFADEVVRYSPRQVTLVPGAGQTIRMMFKVPPNLPEGEYRSHLVFAKPPSAITELPGKEELEPKGVSMKITANIGISIPVIGRHGNLEAKAIIDPASVKISTVGPKQQIGLPLDAPVHAPFTETSAFFGAKKKSRRATASPSIPPTTSVTSLLTSLSHPLLNLETA